MSWKTALTLGTRCIICHIITMSSFLFGRTIILRILNIETYTFGLLAPPSFVDDAAEQSVNMVREQLVKNSIPFHCDAAVQRISQQFVKILPPLAFSANRGFEGPPMETTLACQLTAPIQIG